MPRLAVDAYWRAHADPRRPAGPRARRQSGAPAGWTWRVGGKGLPASFRAAARAVSRAAFRRAARASAACAASRSTASAGIVDLWDAGPQPPGRWHTACVVAWRLWNAPSDHDRMLRRLQARRCAQTGGRLWKTAEIDHRVPLFRVWRERRDDAVAGAAGVLGRCPTCRSSTAMRTPPNAPRRRSIAACVRSSPATANVPVFQNRSDRVSGGSRLPERYAASIPSAFM